MMQILALGNKFCDSLTPSHSKHLKHQRQRCVQSFGFTLLELLIVLTIIAIASAGVVWAIPSGESVQLEREALRLSAQLEAARAQSRSTGRLVTWQADADGYRFTGKVGADGKPDRREIAWQYEGVSVAPPANLVLGPEPLIPAQQVTLSLGAQHITLATNGLAPFEVGEVITAQTGE